MSYSHRSAASVAAAPVAGEVLTGTGAMSVTLHAGFALRGYNFPLCAIPVGLELLECDKAQKWIGQLDPHIYNRQAGWDTSQDNRQCRLHAPRPDGLEAVPKPHCLSSRWSFSKA